MKTWVKLLGLLLCFANTVLYAQNSARQIHIIWLMHNDSPFWKMSQHIAAEAAQDFKMQTTFLLATPGDRLSSAKLVEKTLKELKKDPGTSYYLAMYGSFFDFDKILTLAAEKEVPLFLYNSRPPMVLQARKGTAVQVLGGLYPDDEQAGYAEAKALIAEARRQKKPEPLHMLALGGWNRDTVDEQRHAGLAKAVKEEGVILDQYFQTRWDPEVAKGLVERARQKFSDTHIIWTVADYLGIAALEALGKAADQYTVGGIDWSSDGLASLQKKDGLFVSVGGHFIDPAYLSAVIYDYHQGLDFASIYPKAEILSRLSVLDRSQVDNYRKRFPEEAWGRIDFSQLSRTVSKKANYSFSFDSLKP